MPKTEYCPKCGSLLRRGNVGYVCDGDKCTVSSVKYVREGTILEPIMRQVITYVTVL